MFFKKQHRQENTLFSAIEDDLASVSRKHASLSEKIISLENLIVSVPSVVARRRIRYGDMIPPYDEETTSLSPAGKRLSRTQLQQVRWRRIQGLIFFTILLAAAIAVAAAIYYVASVRGI